MRASKSVRTMAIVLGAIAMLGACGDDDDIVVRTYSDPNANFTSYKTFAFATTGASQNTSATTQAAPPAEVASNLEQVNDEIRAQLEDLGLTEVAADENPDLNAFSLISTRETTGLTWDCVPGGWYGYWAWSVDPCPVIQPSYDTFVAGTVTLGLIDPVLNKAVFGGVARGIVEEDEKNTKKEIDKAVREIFDRYPSGQTGGTAEE